jgi:plasmid stabilization system protein ParE
VRVVIEPAAADELREARRWYARWAGVPVAARFLAEFQRLRTILSREPLRGPELEPGIRRVLFRDRFPYSIIYVVREPRLVIVAVMHQHREPGYWRDRMEGP